MKEEWVQYQGRNRSVRSYGPIKESNLHDRINSPILEHTSVKVLRISGVILWIKELYRNSWFTGTKKT